MYNAIVFHCNSNFLPLILSHREKTEAKKSWLSIDHYTVIFVIGSCSLCMLDTIYFYFIFKVQHYTTNIYHSFLIITWKIEMAPKELHIPQFLFFQRFIFIRMHYHNTRVSYLLWCEFKGYCVCVRDIYAVALARQE